MKNDIAGNPMSSSKWTRKSTRKIADELASRGMKVDPKTAATLLKDMDYSLQANRKNIAETHHPDRSKQFDIISYQRKKFSEKNQPILSMDSKKKEQPGNYKNNGKSWNKKNKPEEVLVHDFPTKGTGKTTPNGLYELTTNRP